MHSWRRDALAGGVSGRAPFLLEQSEEELLRSATMDTGKGPGILPPLAVWFARVVLWISGKTALARYLNVISPLAQQVAELRQVGWLRKFVDHLETLKRRSRSEHHGILLGELGARLGNAPADVSTKGRFPTRLKGRGVAEHCDRLIESCQRLTQTYQSIPSRLVPTAMAALTACDRSSADLPQRLVVDCLEDGQYETLEAAVVALFNECRNRGYAKLLSCLERIETLPKPHQYNNVRKLLVNGATLDDLAWAQQALLVGHFAERSPAVAWVRGFIEGLKQHGIRLTNEEIGNILTVATKRKRAEILARFVAWLGRFAPATLSPRICRLVKKALLDLVVPGLDRLGPRSIGPGM